MSACNSICFMVEGYKNETKTHVDMEYEQEKMAVALISASSCYQVPQQTKIGLSDFCLLHCAVCLENNAVYAVLISSN